jgi:hypothetical protein
MALSRPNPHRLHGIRSPFCRSWIVLFEKVDERWDRQTQAVCIYLTDGYGSFPDRLPELPVLWVVTPGGLDLSQFPFGEAVCLLSL